MQQTNKPYALFISYADADRAWVEGYLLDALRTMHIAVHTEAAFRLGAPLLLEFERAIQQSARTLLVLSPAYLAEEIDEFVNILVQSYGLETATWPVIPLILHPVTLPPRLAMLIALDATNPADWDMVVARLAAALGTPVPAPPVIPDCPYPGMAPFGEADQQLFYGREAETKEIIERLRLHPFLTVIGPSGSGKSSLIFAGVLPALRATRLFGRAQWTVKTMRPGVNPLTTLNALDNSTAESGTHTLLIIDQVEELFTLAGADEIAPFQTALLQRSSAPNVYTLLAVRADFYVDLMNTALWPQIQAHRLEVRPLDDYGLRQAIVRPAERVGVFVEAALVERLVADAATEPGMLPLVQETLVLLWDCVERRFLPLRAYEALVLPHSAYAGQGRTGLQVAMSRRADVAFNTVPVERQPIARRIFLRLIQFGEGRADTRRQQPAPELQTTADDPAQFEETLQHLVSCRLLTLNQDEKRKVRLVDLAHEALISGWPMLGAWLNETRIAEQTRRRLEAKSQEWQRLGQAAGGLLDVIELAEAESWLASPDRVDLGASETLLALVKQSRMTIDMAEKAKEAARQRELAQERRLNRRLRWVVALVTLLFVLAAASAWLIDLSRRDARDARNVAEAQLIQNTDNQMPISLLLAIESLDSSAALQAEDLLRAGLALLPMPRYTIQHAADVIDVAFSPDSQWAASVGEDGFVRVLETATGQLVATLPHTRSVLAASFSADGRLLATGGADHAAHVWDVAAGRELVPPMPHDKDVVALVFSPDGQQLASASNENQARVWDYRQTKVIFTAVHEGVVNGITFSPDGKWLATASDDRTARIWDIVTHQMIAEVSHGGQVFRIAFSPDGRQFATASSDATACIWEAATGEQVGCGTHDDWVEDVAFSPNGNLLATASDDGSVRLWDTITLRERLRMYHNHAVNRVAFHPSGRWLATASQDSTARVWDTASGTEMARMIHEEPIENAIFSPDGHLVATAGWDHQARIWNVDLTAEVARFQQDGYIWGLAFSPDGQQMATASDGGLLAATWRIADKKMVDNLPKTTANVGISAAFSRDLHYLAMPSRDNTLRVWDLQAKREIAQFVLIAPVLAEPDTISALAISPDGRWLAGGSDTGLLYVWEIATQKVILQLQQAESITALAFSASGQQLASATFDGSVHLHSLTGEPTTTQLVESIPVMTMTFSPDETQLAMAAADRSVYVWDINSSEEVGSALKHIDDITSLSFSPDGKWVATASATGLVRIWEIATGQEVTRIRHRGRVQAITFSPDGQWLATASGSVAKIWHYQKLEKARSEELITHVCHRLTRNLDLNEWSYYFGSEFYRQTCKNLPDLSDESKLFSNVTPTYAR